MLMETMVLPESPLFEDDEQPIVTQASRRVIRLMQTPDAFGVGVFAVITRKSTQYYIFKEIPCAIGGRGFAVHRMGLGSLYNVRIGAAHECSCECMGFLRHGRCKHVQGLSGLIGHGLL